MDRQTSREHKPDPSEYTTSRAEQGQTRRQTVRRPGRGGCARRHAHLPCVTAVSPSERAGRSGGSRTLWRHGGEGRGGEYPAVTRAMIAAPCACGLYHRRVRPMAPRARNESRARAGAWSRARVEADSWPRMRVTRTRKCVLSGFTTSGKQVRALSIMRDVFVLARARTRAGAVDACAAVAGGPRHPHRGPHLLQARPAPAVRSEAGAPRIRGAVHNPFHTVQSVPKAVTAGCIFTRIVDFAPFQMRACCFFVRYYILAVFVQPFKAQIDDLPIMLTGAKCLRPCCARCAPRARWASCGPSCATCARLRRR